VFIETVSFGSVNTIVVVIGNWLCKRGDHLEDGSFSRQVTIAK